MRVVVHEYAKGGRTAYETSDDGGEFRVEWAGPRQVGERICALIETACPNTPEEIDRLLEAMAWLTEEIQKRREAMASAPDEEVPAKGKCAGTYAEDVRWVWTSSN